MSRLGASLGGFLKSLFVLCLYCVFASANADLRWIKYTGDIPKNAVTGGYEEGRVLYICQARFNNGLHPGKIVEHGCNIGWGGSEHTIRNFKILVGKAEILWADRFGLLGMPSVNQFHFRRQMLNNTTYLDAWYPFVGGHESNGTPLYICNSQHFTFERVPAHRTQSKGRHPGKIVDHNCNFGYGGDEIVQKDHYMILLVKGQNK